MSVKSCGAERRYSPIYRVYFSNYTRRGRCSHGVAAFSASQLAQIRFDRRIAAHSVRDDFGRGFGAQRWLGVGARRRWGLRANA
jgi:hypothetical protein